MSDYANIFIHKEYNKLLEILEAYIEVKNIDVLDEQGSERIKRVIEVLGGVLESGELLPILFYSDKPQKLVSRYLDFRGLGEAEVLDVWLLDFNTAISRDLLVLLGKYSEDKTIIININDRIEIPELIVEDFTIVNNDVDKCLKLCELTLLLDKSRQYIAEVKPIYAMAPVKTAPSFVSAQAGDLYPL